jgi:hypothetical protein
MGGSKEIRACHSIWRSLITERNCALSERISPHSRNSRILPIFLFGTVFFNFPCIGVFMSTLTFLARNIVNKCAVQYPFVFHTYRVVIFGGIIMPYQNKEAGQRVSKVERFALDAQRGGTE